MPAAGTAREARPGDAEEEEMVGRPGQSADREIKRIQVELFSNPSSVYAYTYAGGERMSLG